MANEHARTSANLIVARVHSLYCSQRVETKEEREKNNVKKKIKIKAETEYKFDVDVDTCEKWVMITPTAHM